MHNFLLFNQAYITSGTVAVLRNAGESANRLDHYYACYFSIWNEIVCWSPLAISAKLCQLIKRFIRYPIVYTNKTKRCSMERDDCDRLSNGRRLCRTKFLGKEFSNEEFNSKIVR